jgi:hypothetical protein
VPPAPPKIEGYTADELLALPDADFEALILCARPLTFRVGTAEILGQFLIRNDRLVIELAHIDGGGEGVLPLLGSIAERYARARGLRSVEWIVHALTCARPNTRLRALLERRGFVHEMENGAPVLRQVKPVPAADRSN